jgi:PAS domain S-box-containing protein
MNLFVKSIMSWLRHPDFGDQDKNLSALHIQLMALIMITIAVILGVVYIAEGQIIYVMFLLASILVQSLVIGLVRFWKLQAASNLFLMTALVLLTLGILSGGGIHSSSVIVYPIILIFASLLLERKPYMLYTALCVASIALVIYAENQKITQPYVPDAPELPLFLSISLIVLSGAVIGRFITESLQNNIQKSRLYAQELSNQKAILDRVGQVVVSCLMDGTIIYWNQAAMSLSGWKAEEAIGRKYYEVIPAQITPGMIEGIRITLLDGRVWSGEVYVPRRDKDPLTVLATISGLRDGAGTLTGWVGVATDLSERVKSEQYAAQHAREVALLYRVGISLTSGKDLVETLLALQEEISHVIRADAFYVAIYDDKTDIIRYPIFLDADTPLGDSPRRLSEQPGLTGAVIFSGKSLYLPDMMVEEVQRQYKPLNDNDFVLHTFLGIPLVVSGRVIGMLSVQSEQVDAYTSDQIQLMENVAIQAAIAIDKANLLDQLKQQLAEREHAEVRLRERESILEAVTFAAEQFLKSPEWRTNMDAVLERFGKTLKVTHAYLFEDHLNAQGEAVTSMRYEWTAPGYPSDLDTPYFQGSKIDQAGFEEQVEALRRGEVRSGNLSTFMPVEKEAMASIGVKAILEVPIFVNGREWGAIGFDDFEKEREWSTAEVDALKIAAGVLSAAIQRQETESSLHESERIYRQAIEAAGAVPYYRNYAENRYEFIGREIENIIGYKAEEITPQFWLEIMRENIPLGEGEGMPIDDAVAHARKGKFKIWRSDMLVVAKNGAEKWITDSAVELFDDSDLSYASVGIMQDVTDRKMTEANLRKREAMLAASTFAAEQFLRAADWRMTIMDVLERLGVEFGASHAYLFEKHMGENGVMLNSLRYEWVAPGQMSDMDKPDYQNAPVQDQLFSRYYSILDSGEPFVGGASYYRTEPTEKEWIDFMGMKALLEMRIVVDGRQWGTIGFDETVNEREWTPMEVDVIRVAANVLGAAIKRQLDQDALKHELEERKQTEASLRKREALLSALAFAAEQFLRTSNWRDAVDSVLERLGRELNVSHAYLFERELDLNGEIRSSMRNEWTAPGEISDLEDDTFHNLSLNNENIQTAYERLNAGLPYIGNSSSFTENERNYWQSLGVKALLEMRIIVDGQQWGLIGFDDSVRERDWLPIEVDVIKVAANVLSAAIKRQLDRDALQSELNEHRQTAQALRFSEEKFSKAFESTQVFMTLENQDHVFVDVNKAFLEGVGYQRDEVIGHNASELNIIYDPEDARRLRQAIRENGSLKDFEIRYRRHSGAVGAVLLSSKKFVVDGQEYTLTSGLDITARKQAEENYRNIFNNSIDGIFQSLDDGRFLTVNPAMARIYGYDSPEEMLRMVNDIGSQLYVDAKQRDEVRRRLAAGERLIGYETFEYRKDGSTFWTSMTAQAVMDETGKVLYYEGTVEDITPRKQAEADREKLIADLESKNTELERFTYTVSHDLKSPLVTINGFLGYLEQDAASGNMDRLKKDMQRIQDAVNKMQRLLNELLELSRIGRMMNSPQVNSFNELIHEALEIVQGRLSGLNVQVDIQPNLPVISGDKPRLVEVLQNLLDNAAKYMGNQPNPRIEIGCQNKEDGKPVFFVRDNGMGIAPEYHERIFGLFNKLDSTSEGTGIGLALVKRIIEVHGGRIWVESELGNGATFYFTLQGSPPS